MTLVAAGFLLSIVGPGGWSLDDAFGLFETNGAPVPAAAGFWIALVGGFGGAAALLAAFWRPQPAAEATDESA